MIIHSSTQQLPFFKRVNYSHETNLIQTNKEVNKCLSTFKSNFRVKKSMSMTKMTKNTEHYNKYYIDPEKRYLKKSIDPKKDIENLKNDQFVYENIHHQQFNNWQHVFETKHKGSQKGNVLFELSQQKLAKLSKFRDTMQSKGRVPLIVNEFLKSASKMPHYK